MAIIYLLIFIMGTFFGSFTTLAVYRIPRKKDITHERSFCPNCNHRLEFLDLIPIFSYIFLGGKCRYCGQKISIRYFLIEFTFGIAALLMFYGIIKFTGTFTYSTLFIFIGMMILFEIIFLFFGVKVMKGKK